MFERVFALQTMANIWLIVNVRGVLAIQFLNSGSSDRICTNFLPVHNMNNFRSKLLITTWSAFWDGIFGYWVVGEGADQGNV